MSKNSIISGAVATLMTAGVVVGLTACGGSSTTTSSTTTSYAGPGSKWDVELNSTASTFDITKRASVNAAVDFTVDGSYTALDSGFLKLTVGSVTGTGGPTVGDIAYALDIPGYAFVLKPLDANSDQVISMVKGGNCPSGAVDANWVMVKSDGAADNAGRDFFGTFNYPVTGAPSLPERYTLTDMTTNMGSSSMTSGSCADGIMNVDNEAVMYLTDNGGAIVHLVGLDPSDPADDQFVLALGQETVSSLDSLDGDYAGLLFDASNASGSMIEPVSMSCASGTCTASVFASNTEIDSNTATGGSATVNLTAINSPSDGFVTGDINGGGGLACMVDTDAAGSGKNIVSCVGQSPGDNANMFNVLFVSK